MEDLQSVARGFVAALPASVEMPAGTGKTQLLAATVCELADSGGEVLVLTHTNAGVHAIQNRLRMLGVTRGCRVATITSFAFTLARAYPQLGQITVPMVPYWPDSAEYIGAANRISGSRHIRRVLSASFTHLLVDEYQDCSRAQHAFICTLADAIPATGVLGDPLQAIFGFADPLVSGAEVEARFPRHVVPIAPWRWTGHNDALGAWLLEVRHQLTPDRTIDFGPSSLPENVTFERSSGDPRTLQLAARRARPSDETVLVITGPGRRQPRAAASALYGQFSVMEEISGEFMHTQITKLTAAKPAAYALWLAELVRDCFCPYGDIDRDVLKKLENGKTVAHLKRPGFEKTLEALDVVVSKPTLASLARAMDTVSHAGSPRLHSHEAWFDIQTAIRGAIAGGDDTSVLAAELAMARDRIRHSGRSVRRRVVSRTVLVKGLEFDHVIIADVAQVCDAHNLYVALTRARKSLVIIGNSPTLTVRATQLEPKPKGEGR
ncbi:MAG: hypothetical protein QOG53_1523 [Frankiales bacterium]|jgi:hypothetical protein|nr:hypothetical protein [Frankiales bacterium]